MSETRFRIVVDVDPTQAKPEIKGLEKSLEGVESAADSAALSLNDMLQLIGIGAAIAKVHDLVGAFADIDERISAITDSSDELAARMESVFQVAQRTYTGFAKTADNVVRLANATGGATDASLGLIETLQKAAQLGETSAESQAAGIDSYIDAIEKGKLGTLGLLSVLQKTPVAADLVAKSLGKTRDELPKLAMAGKLTGQVLVDALTGASDEINARFEGSLPSIEDGMTSLTNAATMFFGQLASGSGLLGTVGAALAFLGDNFETIGRVAVAAGEVLAVIFVGKGINAAIAGIRALGIAAAANPLGALLLGLGSAIALFTQFADKIDAGVDGTIKMSDVLSVLWGDIKKLGSAIYELLQGAWGGLTAAFETGIPTDGIEMSMKNAAIFVASFVDVTIGLFKSIRDNALPIFGGMAVSIGEFFVKIAQDIAKVFEVMINGIIASINKVTGIASSTYDFFAGDGSGYSYDQKAGTFGFKKGNRKATDLSIGKVDFGFKNPLEGAGSSTLDLMKKAASDVANENSAKDYVASVFDRASSSTASAFNGGNKGVTTSGAKDGLGGDGELTRTVESINELADAMARVRDEGAKLRDVGAVDLPGASPASVEQMQAWNAEQQRYAEIVDSIRGPLEAYQQTLADVTALEASGAITTKEYTDFVNKLNAEFAKSQPVNEWADTIEKSVKPAIMDALTQMSDAFLEFARTGKGSFSDMVDSILANLQRLLLNKLITKLVDAAFGGSAVSVPGVGSAGGAVAGLIGGAISGGGGGGGSSGGGGGSSGDSARRRSDGGGNAPIIRLYNITDPNAPINAIASSGGEQAVMRVMAKNANTVRNLTRR